MAKDSVLVVAVIRSLCALSLQMGKLRLSRSYRFRHLPRSVRVRVRITFSDYRYYWYCYSLRNENGVR